MPRDDGGASSRLVLPQHVRQGLSEASEAPGGSVEIARDGLHELLARPERLDGRLLGAGELGHGRLVVRHVHEDPERAGHVPRPVHDRRGVDLECRLAPVRCFAANLDAHRLSREGADGRELLEGVETSVRVARPEELVVMREVPRPPAEHADGDVVREDDGARLLHDDETERRLLDDRVEQGPLALDARALGLELQDEPAPLLRELGRPGLDHGEDSVRELAPGRDPELAEGREEVRADRGRAQAEDGRDLLVREPAHALVDDAALAGREALLLRPVVERIGGARCGLPPRDPVPRTRERAPDAGEGAPVGLLHAASIPQSSRRLSREGDLASPVTGR